MKQLLLGGITLCVHLYFFLAFGSLFLRALKKEERFSWCFVPVLGFFLYYSLFEILALPMTLLLVPLHVLTVVWGAALAAVGLAAVFLCGRMWMRGLKRLFCVVRDHKALFFLVGLVTLGQMAYVAAYDQNSADAAYYVANVSTSLYTDTLGRYNPYTGLLSSRFNVRYVTATYYLESAVFCSMFQVHPMVLTKTIAPMILLLLVNLLWYHLGMVFFRGERRKAAAFAVALAFFQLFMGNPVFAGFLYYRAYEGKAMLQGLVVPFLLLASLRLYENAGDRLAWWSIFFTSLGALCLTTSSMTLVPAAVLAGVLPVVVKNKRIRLVFPAFACILPDVAVMALYLTVRLGMIRLAAK